MSVHQQTPEATAANNQAAWDPAAAGQGQWPLPGSGKGREPRGFSRKWRGAGKPSATAAGHGP
eukprot:6297790-Lingulodinium_polyedra.AAC.1